MNKLSPKQEKFCQEFLLSGNATQAYTKAGYKPDPNGGRASRLIGNDRISKRLDEIREKDTNKFTERFEDKRDKLMRNYEAAHELGQAVLPAAQQIALGSREVENEAPVVEHAKRDVGIGHGEPAHGVQGVARLGPG